MAEIIEGNEKKVVVDQASVLMGMRRTRLKITMDAALSNEADLDRKLLGLVIYPDLVAAVVDHQGFAAWPPAFEEFLALPEEFAARWEQAAYRLNPHWLPAGDAEPGEKKAPTS